MFRMTVALVALPVLAALLTPAKVDAYGAAHVGYTHVGPNGVYHTGETAVAGPGGVYAGGHTTAAGYGGGYAGGYHAGYRGAYGGATYGGAAYGGRVYAPSYSAGYAYVR